MDYGLLEGQDLDCEADMSPVAAFRHCILVFCTRLKPTVADSCSYTKLHNCSEVYVV